MVVKYFYSKIIHLILVELCFRDYNSAEAVRQSDKRMRLLLVETSLPHTLIPQFAQQWQQPLMIHGLLCKDTFNWTVPS